MWGLDPVNPATPSDSNAVGSHVPSNGQSDPWRSRRGGSPRVLPANWQCRSEGDSQHATGPQPAGKAPGSRARIPQRATARNEGISAFPSCPRGRAAHLKRYSDHQSMSQSRRSLWSDPACSGAEIEHHFTISAGGASEEVVVARPREDLDSRMRGNALIKRDRLLGSSERVVAARQD